MTMTSEETAELTRGQMYERIAATGWDEWQQKLARTVLGLRGDGRQAQMYGIVRSVSRSGMNRRIDLLAPFGSDVMLVRPQWFTLYKLARTGADGYQVGGTGMDMGFHLLDSMYHQCLRLIGVERDQWRYQEHMPRLRYL